MYSFCGTTHNAPLSAMNAMYEVWGSLYLLLKQTLNVYTLLHIELLKMVEGSYYIYSDT